MEDWYKVSHKAIEETEGGSKILARYTSLELALKASYPDFAWANKFTQTRSARYFFDDVDKQRELLEQIGQELGVKEVRASLISQLLIFESTSLRIGMG